VAAVNRWGCYNSWRSEATAEGVISRDIFFILTLTQYMSRDFLYLMHKNHLEQFSQSHWKTLADSYPPAYMVLTLLSGFI
jgi:hypothetical protein